MAMSQQTKASESGDGKALISQEKKQGGRPKRTAEESFQHGVKSRVGMNKAIRQEDLRKRIKGGKLIGKIKKIIKTDYTVATYIDQETGEQCTAQLEPRMAQVKIQQAKLHLDAARTLLAKELPDLRTVEVVNIPQEQRMTREELLESIAGKSTALVNGSTEGAVSGNNGAGETGQETSD